MARAAQNATANPGPRQLTISYREAARLTGRSVAHVYRVVSGERESRRLLDELRPYLRPLEDGIGKN